MDTQHFKVSEFSCKCGMNNIDQRVLNMAETIRQALGVLSVSIPATGARYTTKLSAVSNLQSTSRDWPPTCLAQRAQSLCSRLLSGSRLTANFLTSITAFVTNGGYTLTAAVSVILYGRCVHD